MVHDAIIVQKKNEQEPAEQRRLEQAVEAALSEAMQEHGWARGSKFSINQ